MENETDFNIDWVAFDEIERWDSLSEREKLGELGAPSWLLDTGEVD